jgi:hypothetical protein
MISRGHGRNLHLLTFSELTIEAGELIMKRIAEERKKRMDNIN